MYLHIDELVKIFGEKHRNIICSAFRSGEEKTKAIINERIIYNLQDIATKKQATDSFTFNDIFKIIMSFTIDSQPLSKSILTILSDAQNDTD